MHTESSHSERVSMRTLTVRTLSSAAMGLVRISRGSSQFVFTSSFEGPEVGGLGFALLVEVRRRGRTLARATSA